SPEFRFHCRFILSHFSHSSPCGHCGHIFPCGHCGPGTVLSFPFNKNNCFSVKSLYTKGSHFGHWIHCSPFGHATVLSFPCFPWTPCGHLSHFGHGTP